MQHSQNFVNDYCNHIVDNWSLTITHTPLCGGRLCMECVQPTVVESDELITELLIPPLLWIQTEFMCTYLKVYLF